VSIRDSPFEDNHGVHSGYGQYTSTDGAAVVFTRVVDGLIAGSTAVTDAAGFGIGAESFYSDAAANAAQPLFVKCCQSDHCL
jgi:hypothetical protein